MAITAALLIWYWPRFSELALVVRPIRSVLIGGVCGILVFIIWRALDQSWASIGTGRPVENARALWALRPELALVRIIGVVLVVPIMEELFWRSFIMRWSEKSAFLNVSPAEIGFRSLAISAILFGLEHQLIVAGVVAGFFYGELYRRSGNLWMVIMAHATTNLALEFF